MNQDHAAEFRSTMPAIVTGPVAAGQPVYDEGVFMCVACNLGPGMEVSLMPGELAPTCPHCGDGAAWQKT